jgi:two-component system NtrC family response regulator
LVITIPPLRQRKGDPVLLARHFLNIMGEQNKRQLRNFSADAIAAIEGYGCPGNVRELENRMKRAVIMAEGPLVTAVDLDLPTEAQALPVTLKEARERAERDAVQGALAESDGNVTQAAKLLDVSRPTLYDLMRYYSIRS